jgi:methionyl-tRNA synthetase
MVQDADPTAGNPPATAGPEPTPAPEVPRPLVSLARFAEVELRVARVVSAERVPKADRLLKLEIDLGQERRQIVAGIAATYAPEALVGKSLIVVANLEPARIRGVESRGMLLAADAGAGPIVATFEADVPPGTRVR